MKPIFGLLLSCAVVIGCLAKRPQTQTLERGPDNATLVLAKNEHQPAAIDVDEKSVYWIAEDRSAIHKVNKAGGAITTVVDDQAGIRRMIVDKDLIYFLTNKEIRRVPATGGKAMTLVVFADLGAGESLYWYLALDTNNVYFVGGPENKQQIMKVGKAGGKPVALATVNLPSGLASDGVNVYWTDYLEETIKRVPITGGEPATVGDCEKPGSGGLAVDSTSVYCTSAEGKVLRFARSNGAVTTIANVENAAFDQILIDERSVYALSVIQGIYRIDKRGEPAVRLVPLDRVSANFAIDEQNLYWSNYDEGTVNRRRK